MHGRAFENDVEKLGLLPPTKITNCSAQARPGYNTQLAHEYLDDEVTLRKKVKKAVALFKMSHNPSVYSGAGISTQAGVADYASEAAGTKSLVANMRQRRMSPWEAQPTLAHRVMCKIHKQSLAYKDSYKPFVWIQQNHDGLPQKAGFPQEWLNEIHGAWYDPSNPVVAMEGALRQDLFQWLEWLVEVTDFVLVLGTSLSGMNADRIVSTVARKSLNVSGHANTLGAVIVSLQRTSMDDSAAVRIFSTIDKFASLFCEELGLTVPVEQAPAVYLIKRPDEKSEDIVEDVYEIPYDGKTGKKSEKSLSTLDMRDGQTVKLMVGVHKGDVGEIMGRDRQGHYEIRFQHKLKKSSKITRPFMRKLGAWWIEAALHGQVEQMPIMNTA